MKSAREAALILHEIYSKSFGGKRKGRYKISRTNLTRLAHCKRLKDTMIEEIADEALVIGYALINLGEYLVVIDEDVMVNYRTVPKTVMNEFLGEPDDEDEDVGKNRLADDDAEEG